MEEELEDKHVVISVSTIALSMERTCEHYSRINAGSTIPTIYSVHKNLRHDNSDCYEPKLISIGPFHRNKLALMPMQPLKWKYLGDLIARSPEYNKMGKYVDAMWQLQQRARNQYSHFDLPPELFVETLVLDGCFIVEFFVKRALGNVGSPWKDVKWNLPLLRNDLLLLENQLPFFVLEELYNISHVPLPNGVDLKFTDLALHYISKDKVQDLPNMEEIHHLLHLHHICQLRYLNKSQEAPVPEPKHLMPRAIVFPKKLLATAFFFLVSLILMCKFPRHKSAKRGGNNKAPRVIPCATKLKQAGVKFKGKQDKCYLNVTFNEDGLLELPFLPIQQNTFPQFRNMIAFEQCCPRAGSEFTAYAVFMDQLIDTAKDVEILEKYNIIESKLGSDEDVAKLFNGICKGASLNYDDHYLKDLFVELNEYCVSDHHRWRAELVQGYFKNPWAAASVIAAFILLVATLLQTIFTVMSYWHH